MATRQDLAQRFSTLYQGANMTVAEYHSRFIQLGQFALQSLVADEPTMAWKFTMGLRTEFRTYVISQRVSTLDESKDIALALEADYRRSDFRSRAYRDVHQGRRRQPQQQYAAPTAP